MRIIFVNSPLQDYGKIETRDYYTTPPLGLGYLATLAKNMNNEVKLIDSEALGLPLDKTVSDVLNYSPDMVGINLLSPTMSLSKNIIKGLKIKNPELKIIAGGPHATIRPNQTLKGIPEIDIIVRGEGESPLEEILNGKQSSEIKRIP